MTSTSNAEKIPPPGIPEVTAIIGLESQPILRNLKITQCYRDLSQAISAQVGSDNLNWCSFATWASKTAGRFIRADEILPVFRATFAGVGGLAERLDTINRLVAIIAPEARLSFATLLDALAAPVEEVSRQIAAGNLAVFAELGPMFSLMCTGFAAQARYDAVALAALVRELALRDGLPTDGGQGYLKSAVQLYGCAKFEPNRDRRAELILLANAQTGLHEQIRLQPTIAGALAPPFNGVLRRLYQQHYEQTLSGLVRTRMNALFQTTLMPLFAELEAELNRVWRETVTRLLMTFELPDGEIHLGKDLRAEPGKSFFPSSLKTIEYGDLRQLLHYYHADGDGSAGSAARDWADIPERMRFILTLFRSRQQTIRLFEQPFSSDQRMAIAANRVPSGPL